MPKKSTADSSQPSQRSQSAGPGRFSYSGLERVFHEKARLGIMTCLISHASGLAFSDLKELCAVSDGNLNRHLEVLKEAKLIEIEKVGAGRNAKSTVQITRSGQLAFARYLQELQRVIEDAAHRVELSVGKLPTDKQASTKLRAATSFP